MSTFIPNTTQKIESAVNVSVTPSPSAITTITTIPANSSFKGQIGISVFDVLSSGPTLTIFVSGVRVDSLVVPVGTTVYKSLQNIIAGPGQTIQYQLSASASASIGVSGVIEKNTP